jgi:hypothetical protein
MISNSFVVVVGTDVPEPTQTAEWAEKLAACLEPQSQLLLRENARRLQLLASLAPTPGPGGLAFFGHGNDDRLCGQGLGDSFGEAIVDRVDCEQDTQFVRGRWLYAFACRAANQLGPAAQRAGCSLFAGWEKPIRVPEKPVAEETCALAVAVLALPLALAAGERSILALRTVLRDACASAEEALEGRLALAAMLLLSQLEDVVLLDRVDASTSAG